jgi:hypothetical protein
LQHNVKHQTLERYMAKLMSKAGLIQAIAEEHSDEGLAARSADPEYPFCIRE